MAAWTTAASFWAATTPTSVSKVNLAALGIAAKTLDCPLQRVSAMLNRPDRRVAVRIA
jgi:hypothetical protein